MLSDCNISWVIPKTRLYNFDPLKPHFFYSKNGVYILFLILLKIMDCGYSLEPPENFPFFFFFFFLL